MTFQHKKLASGRWKELSFFQQMANIGSEVERAINWKNKDEKYSRMALERSLELIDLTIADDKNRERLKELCRIREVLIDYLLGKNEYSSSGKSWKNYFYGFAFSGR